MKMGLWPIQILWTGLGTKKKIIKIRRKKKRQLNFVFLLVTYDEIVKRV
jgi:hypothetical protein